jgi:tripartite-type tricarboxylate transporter receptor subunit TctC
LNRDINAALKQDANKERLLREGLEVVGSTPEEFGTQIRTEIQRWKKVVQTAGIPVE